MIRVTSADGTTIACERLGSGPALILENGATTFVDPAWRAEMTALGDLVLERVGAVEAIAAVGTTVDPVLLEIFNNRFMGVAEEMGLALQTTAASVNIRERLDFSCAVFDAAGGLVANAPHIPVHLGSMGESIRTVIREREGSMKPGDVYMLNAPHAGGTHLPDITVIAPVILEGDTAPAFFTAARGHHADIGGITPGSPGVQPDGLAIAPGSGSSGGSRKAGGASKSTQSSRSLAFASRHVSAGRFHLVSISFSTDVKSCVTCET